MPWDAILPAGAAFLLVASVVIYGSSRPLSPPSTPPPLTARRVRAMLRSIAVVALGGYLVLLLVVVVFSVWLIGDAEALRSAAWGAPALLAIAVPVFVALSWLEGRLRG